MAAITLIAGGEGAGTTRTGARGDARGVLTAGRGGYLCRCLAASDMRCLSVGLV